MKYFILCLSLLITSLSVFAQGAHDANIRFGKIDRPGLLVEFPYSKGITEAAVKARFEKMGLNRPKTERGFMAYLAAKWDEMSATQLDVYIKVDANKGDNQSTVILLVSKGYDNYVSPASDPELVAKLKAWMDAMLPEIQAVQKAADIKDMEEALALAEKAYKDADEDGNKLAREKERIEKRMAENNALKQSRADAVAAAKGRLEQVRGK